MEFKNVVFNAARDGKLRRLKVFLDHRPRDEVKMLVSYKTNGATPLVIAAKNGHAEVVDYLIVRCEADIEQIGSVQFDGETIEGAPPLWCAAAAGHLDVVRALIVNGANVNSTTKSKSTPLRAACYDGHFDIVQYLFESGADIEIANRHGHTCLMIACYKGHYNITKFLIDCGADVNRKSAKGNTALHDCAECGSIEIMKLLLESSAKMDVDSYGVTPLLAAALTGHTSIVELLLSRQICTKREIVDALELLGATFVDKKRDMTGALDLWRRALSERYSDGANMIEKTSRLGPVVAYDNAVEVTTMEQLEELVSEPDEMRMQALLVRERILGPSHPDTSYYIRYRGAVYADTGNFDRCLRLWIYALDMQQKILDPMSPMTQSSLLSFAELFSFMMSKSITMVKFSDLFGVFQRALCELQAAILRLSSGSSSSQRRSSYQGTAMETLSEMDSFMPLRQQMCHFIGEGIAPEHDTTSFHRTLIIVLHLIGLLCRLKPFLTLEDDYELRKAVYRLVRLNPKGKNGSTPLHLACIRDSTSYCLTSRYPLCDFPMIEVINLLLDVGASPHALDYGRNSPLHVVASLIPPARMVFKTLLERGAHLDTRNTKGETPLQLMQRNATSTCSTSTPAAATEFFPLKFLSLQCLCAQVINQERIPIGEIDDSLQEFVEIH